METNGYYFEELILKINKLEELLFENKMANFYKFLFKTLKLIQKIISYLKQIYFNKISNKINNHLLQV